jgi:hypothetical protein
MEGDAIAKEVRAHGDYHVDRQGFARRTQEQGDETVGLVGVPLPVAEDFLELVYHQQQGLAFESIRFLAVQLGQGQRAGAEHCRQRRERSGVLAVVSPTGVFAQCVRQIGQWSVAGLEGADVPATRRAGIAAGRRVQCAPVQRRNQSGAYQRRFAAARGTEHGGEALPAFELGEQFTDLRLAAEKQQRLVFGERAQTDVGRWQAELDALHAGDSPRRKSARPCSLTATTSSDSMRNSLATVPLSRYTPQRSSGRPLSASWLRK